MEKAKTRKGFIKVKLYYQTNSPKHTRSFLLKEQMNILGPYFESLSILYPQNKSYPLLENYLPAFNALKKANLVEPEDTLYEFYFQDEDIVTQAYVIE